MRRKEKAEKIRVILDQLHPDPKIPLNHRDPYTLLVALLLSAQCTDARVNRVTPELFRHAATPRKMVALGSTKVRSLIFTCGLSTTKATALIALSRQLEQRHAGRVPDNFPDLEALPGIGHKTASVIMAQAFGFPTFPVDTHVHRLAARWGLSDGSHVRKTEEDLKAMFPRETWNRLHLQLIHFGRTHCTARRHDVDTCPICSWATAGGR